MGRSPEISPLAVTLQIVGVLAVLEWPKPEEELERDAPFEATSKQDLGVPKARYKSQNFNFTTNFVSTSYAPYVYLVVPPPELRHIVSSQDRCLRGRLGYNAPEHNRAYVLRLAILAKHFSN